MLAATILFALIASLTMAAETTTVEEAKARTLRRTQKQTKWEGPTTSPPAAKNKKIAWINADAQNAVEMMWGDAVAEAAKLMGWETMVLDGKGTVQGQIAAINQAISVKVDGIAICANVEPLQSALAAAAEQGITIVGLHATNEFGPNPDLNLFTNITTKGTDIGEALGDFAIAHSDGKGRVVVIYDAEYAIAREKSNAMRERAASCPTMTVLDYVNAPVSDVTRNMPQLTSAWISGFGTPLYILATADYYFDFVTPTLRSGDVPTTDMILCGADGTEAAYDRIRHGDYQICTVPEPPGLFGYMAVDALNRAFNGEGPHLFKPEVYVVTSENINEEGGEKNMFVPSNNFAEHYAEIWGVK